MIQEQQDHLNSPATAPSGGGEETLQKARERHRYVIELGNQHEALLNGRV